MRSIFISHILLKISKDDSYTLQCVNLSKANLKPSSSKMVKFGKKISKNYNNSNEVGISWRDKGYKYKSPFERDYLRNGYRNDEIVIYAKPGKLTCYIFYDKNRSKLFYGVTDSSFTFRPNQTVSIWSEEIESLSQVPDYIDVCFVDGVSKVNVYRKNFQQSPIPVIMLAFRPRIFSSSFVVSEMDSPIPGDPSFRFDIYLPYTGIKKKELLREWMRFKNGIPRQVNLVRINEAGTSYNRIIEDIGDEPADVTRDRLQRDRAIEAAIEAADLDYDNLTLHDLPEPDERGYINFEGLETDSYDINNPERLFHSFRYDDNGYIDCFAINGKFVKFNPDGEVKVDYGQYAFYWCPGDETFGIRYKKEVGYTGLDNEEGSGQGDQGQNSTQDEREPAPMVNKYIYLEVLNPGLMGEMKPARIDFYTKSYFHLGRLEYDEVNIRRKDQVWLPKSDFVTAWENRMRN